MTSLPSFIRRLALAAFGLLAFALGLLIVTVLLTAGLLAAAGVLVWSRLRGRRPSTMAWRPARAATAYFFRKAAASPFATQADGRQVVDVVARDITPRGRPLVRE